ncbi:MAG TPA: hypothetical protein VF641_09250 [Methylobacterium sp.]
MASSSAPALPPDLVRAEPIAAGRDAWFGTSSLVFLALVVGLIARPDKLLADPDTQWHVAVGRWIVAHGAVPWTDLFSHTFAGQPWIAKEWASQVVLFAVHAGAGWWGVAVCAVLVLASTLAVLHAWLGRRMSGASALVLVVATFVILAPHILARPHLFTFPILIAWTIGLVGAIERRGAPSPWLLLVMVAWANLHGSYPIGLVIAGLLAGEGVFGRPRAEWRRSATRWGLFLVGAALAACLTPYGTRPFLVNLGLFGSGESLRYIDEWQPLALDLSGSLALACLGLCLGVLACDPRRNLFRIAVVFLLGAMMIRHSRFADLFILVAPILVAGPAALRFAGLRAEAPSVGNRLDRLAVAVLALAALGLAALQTPRLDPEVTPVAALEAARAKGLHGPVYNDYNFGGFLIASGVKTFIDGRADQIFLGGFMDALFEARTDADGERFAALLRRYGITWALVQKGGKDAAHLARLDGWAMLHQDDVAAVYYDTRRDATAPGRP